MAASRGACESRASRHGRCCAGEDEGRRALQYHQAARLPGKGAGQACHSGRLGSPCSCSDAHDSTVTGRLSPRQRNVRTGPDRRDGHWHMVCRLSLQRRKFVNQSVETLSIPRTPS